MIYLKKTEHSQASTFFGGTRLCDFAWTKNNKLAAENPVQDWARNRTSDTQYCMIYNRGEKYSWSDVPCELQDRRILCETTNGRFSSDERGKSTKKRKKLRSHT